LKSLHRRLLLAAIILLTIALAAFLIPIIVMPSGPYPRLMVYCAHDSIYAEGILKDFTARTGIRVYVRYDTEATKSLGLVELLLREKEAPRCDLFWNNELLGTVRLQKAGVLQPYKGSGWQRIPDAYKDPAGAWTGFGGRMRVYIINTQRMAADPAKVQEHLASADLSRVAIAKPLYGTTFTQYALLHRLWGEEKLKAWHADCRKRGISEVGGNAQVKNVVASGDCDLGFTDSDDCCGAMDEGKPVAMLPLRLDDGKTICIPNTISIIKGTKRLAQAQALADYLLSAECEMALAKSESRQIPLGPVDEKALPEDVKQLKEWAAEGCSMAGLGPDADATLAWLKSVYVQ